MKQWIRRIVLCLFLGAMTTIFIDINSEPVLPQRPFYPGFLTDTLLYALLWFGLILGAAAARMFIRQMRGRCPSCGYDLQGALDVGCLECGWNRICNGQGVVLVSSTVVTEADHLTCGGCGYDLHGLEGLTCPECGAVNEVDPDVLKAARHRKIGITIAAAVITGIVGAFLQLLGLGALAAHGNSTGWLLIIFFGPMGVIFMCSMVLGFLLYPLYCVIISVMPRPAHTAKILAAIHYGAVPVGIYLGSITGTIGTFSDNCQVVAGLFRREPGFMSVAVGVFLLANLLLGGHAFMIDRVERRTNIRGLRVVNNPANSTPSGDSHPQSSAE